MRRNYKDVSAQEFVEKYNLSKSIGFKYEYIGLKHGYHVMDYYDIGTRDWLDYRYSIRTKQESLPANFPDHPQVKNK